MIKKQSNNYQVLKNGQPLQGSTGTIDQVIAHIRLLETGLDRFRQHSPYTIGVIN